MTVSRENKILKNTIIYAVGNFGSKILAYIMVLVYTYYIGAEELGYYDLILTTISLFLPIIICSYDEGIYRWLIDDSKRNKIEIVSNCIKTVIFTTCLAIIVLLLINVKFHIQYVGFIAAMLGSSTIYQVILNAVRGMSNSHVYALSGIINSVILLFLEILGLVVLGMGIEALLISKTMANILTILFIFMRQPSLRGFLTCRFNTKLSKSMLSYSLPLIPNSLSWWIVNSSDRYIILLFLGTAYNGIYAIANKFPTIITTITGIVYLALQESVIKEYDSPDRDSFYSKVFRQYYTLIFSLIICAIPATKLMIGWFVSTEYQSAWQYTGFLYLSTVFSALSSFLGIGYQISRETKRSVVSTVSSAGVNIAVNIMLIQFIGLYAASFSTFAAYLFLFVLRIIHSKKYFTLHIKWSEFISMFIISILVSVVTYIGSLMTVILTTVVCIALMLILNKKFALHIIEKIEKINNEKI